MQNIPYLCCLHDLCIVHGLRGITRTARIPVRTAHKPAVRKPRKFCDQSYRNSFSENAKGLWPLPDASSEQRKRDPFDSEFKQLYVSAESGNVTVFVRTGFHGSPTFFSRISTMVVCLIV